LPVILIGTDLSGVLEYHIRLIVQHFKKLS